MQIVCPLKTAACLLLATAILAGGSSHLQASASGGAPASVTLSNPHALAARQQAQQSAAMQNQPGKSRLASSVHKSASVPLLADISTGAGAPPWPASSVVYCVYPSIFSPQGNFAGVTAQLGRLKTLGVTVVWLMPVTPIGHPINGHPAFGSPYCVHDYYAVNPSYGTEADLHQLITKAHALGLRIILDEVLNHTAWDNALITQHPEYYVHSDGNPNNPASIVQAFNFPDVAQLNYASADLRTYMITMLQFWVSQYGVDGFRFDTADDPGGPNRMIPADFWQALGTQLRQQKPAVLLLGECETASLARKPFALDYGWSMYSALKNAFNGGDASSQMQGSWLYQENSFPSGMKHLSLQDDWDDNRDIQVFGGAGGAQAAAVFNLTQTGVPLIYNGMEIGNAAGSVNPHAPIDWAAGDSRFPSFYHQMLALRRNNPALHEGAMTWLTNSLPVQVITYERTGRSQEFLVEINCSAAAASGTVQAPAGVAWTEVKIAGVQGHGAHPAPPQVSLPPKGFALFKRLLPKP